MLIKVSEATNRQIDWLVAKCEAQRGEESKGPDWLAWLVPAPSMIPHYRPSTDWAQGGPIVEREDIDVCRTPGLPGHWFADKLADEGFTTKHGFGLLTAAMRCYVASKLGDEVDVPEETGMKLELGKEYRHRDGRHGELIAPHPHDGACLVMEETRRADGEILTFFTCEQHDLIEVEVPEELCQ